MLRACSACMMAPTGCCALKKALLAIASVARAIGSAHNTSLVGRIEAGGSGFEEYLNNAVSHFKLLRVALCEKRINALADISWVFFSFQE